MRMHSVSAVRRIRGQLEQAELFQLTWVLLWQSMCAFPQSRGVPVIARASFLLLLLLGSVIRTACDTPSSNVEVVSLVQLIATPEKYDGKTVLVIGFLRLEFEGNALYLHAEDYQHSITQNSVWVVRNAIINGQGDALNMHYVMLGGTFDAEHKGHMGLSSGSLTNIKVAELWPPHPPKRTP
jgi:hypothetical protein